jgi:uncharacterized protein (DUF2062 family)
VKYLSKLKDYILKFSKKGLSTNEIAFGIALGNFIGFIPVIGTHTLAAIGLSYVLRLNTLIVLLGTQISNPLSYPFQLFFSAEVGNLIMKGEFLDITFSKNLNYLSYYLVPIIVGSLVLGTLISCISYGLVKFFLKRRKNNSDGLESNP